MSEIEKLANAMLWDTLDLLVEHPFATTEQIVAGMKEMIDHDPGGAARRASGFPHYDQDRMDADLDRARREVARMGGTEHEPVPDGGGETPLPHPQSVLVDCE